MKKRFFLLLLTTFLFVTSHAQFMTFKRMYYENSTKFLKTKLMVAIDEETQPELLEKFKVHMEKIWTHTEYEFINPSDVEKYLKNDKYSVMTLVKHTEFKNSEEALYYSLMIMVGNKEYKSMNDLNKVAIFDLPVIMDYKKGSKLLDYSHIVKFIISSLRSDVIAHLNKEDKPKLSRKGKAFYCKDCFDNFHNKKRILICKQGLSKDFDIDDFCSKFRLERKQVEIVSKEVIEKCMEDQDPSEAFMYDYLESNGSFYDAVTFKLMATNDVGKIL